MNLAFRSSRAPAGRIAYVDGRYLPHGAAAVHIEDRGLQFADSVYEVYAVSSGRLMDEAKHLDRLERSLAAIDMPLPLARKALQTILREVVRRNRLRGGLIYLQITRGAWPRDHAVPAGARPSVIVTARRVDAVAAEKRRATGVAVITAPDIRWGRCDIKSTALLPNVLAKTQARRAGAYEAWFCDRAGLITEGSSTNAWIVDASGVVITRSLSESILPGVTRAAVLEAASDAGMSIRERAFSVKEAYAAREAFLSSAGGGIVPVTSIDGRKIGDGKPGSTTARLAALYHELSQREAGL